MQTYKNTIALYKIAVQRTMRHLTVGPWPAPLYQRKVLAKAYAQGIYTVRTVYMRKHHIACAGIGYIVV